MNSIIGRNERGQNAMVPLVRLTLSLCAFLCIALIAQASEAAPPWVQRILNGRLGGAFAAHQDASVPPGATRAEFKSGGSLQVILSGGGLSAAVDACQEANHTAYLGDVRRAHDIIWRFMSSHPESWELTVDDAIETSLALRRYDEAFGQLCKLLKVSGRGTDLRFVELAVASAGLGEVVPGQSDYVSEKLGTWYREGHGMKSLRLPALRQAGASDVAARGFLALGMRAGTIQAGYLDACLQLQPRNIIAARESVELYASRGEFSSVRRICNLMAQQLPAGSDRDYFAIKEHSVSGLADRNPASPHP